jgi:phage shock protein C
MRQRTGRWFERLRRYPQRGYIAGVCAGLGELLGCPAKVIRLGAILALFLTSFFPVILVYGVLWFLMEPFARDGAPYRATARSGRLAHPRHGEPGAFEEAKLRFERLEQRLRRMESCVTSEQFELRRQLRALEAQVPPGA